MNISIIQNAYKHIDIYNIDDRKRELNSCVTDNMSSSCSRCGRRPARLDGIAKKPAWSFRSATDQSDVGISVARSVYRVVDLVVNGFIYDGHL